MINNIKFMLLGIFLAVMSVGGFILADEEEIFLVIAIILPIMAVYTFIKGFRGCDEKQTQDEQNQETLLISQATIIE